MASSSYPYPCVHHIEMGVTDGPRVVSMLRDNFTFDVVATRNSKVARQWLLVKQDTRYLITSLKPDSNKHDILEDDYVIDWMDVSAQYLRPGTEHRQRKDSVFNLCLQVSDLDLTLKRLESCGVFPVFHQGVKTISDCFGSVRMCTVKSCVGDVYHTLVEKNNVNSHKSPQYTGTFLPGFIPVHNSDIDSVKEQFWENYNERYKADNDYDKNACSIQNNCNTATCDNKNRIEVEEDSPVITKDSAISPTTTSVPSNEKSVTPVWTVFDHIAIAVEMGTSGQVMDWYERCFGMKRFLINSDEDKDEGLVVSSDIVSLRLRAMEYWKCAETGLESPLDDSSQETRKALGNRLSMVVVEGLPPSPTNTEVNQVECWLRQHGSPGIQHIALSTHDIKATVACLKEYGVEFATPPPLAYYKQEGRYEDIMRAGEDVEQLKQHGILIDTEADRRESRTPIKNRYLLQIFTKPFLPKDPCFMEIIQREGAMGFGSGNIAALYRSIQAGITEKAKGLS